MWRTAYCSFDGLRRDTVGDETTHQSVEPFLLEQPVTTLALIVLLVLGTNTIVWGLFGIGRVVARRLRPSSEASIDCIAPAQVAVLIAAHNEELGIAQCIRAALETVPRGNVYVVSDGSTDRTTAIARRHGARVLELSPNRGKARALVAGLEHFALSDRYEVVAFLDADTALTSDYLASGLTLFNDPEVVAVAGRASTLADPKRLTRIGRFLVAYRERFYIAVQFLIKFGQAARVANAVAIVPGFASMYRSRVLTSIDIDVPGLVIEDFNMTFEVHAKRLGRIAFHPGRAIAFTQDPATVRDYVHQVRRWFLGFWQTVRRHGVHHGRFWYALAFYTTELVVSSVVLVLALPIGLTTLIVAAPGVEAPEALETLAILLPPWVILLGIVLPDYVLTLLAVAVTRRASYLWLGLLFPAVRLVDAMLCLRTIPLAFSSSSDGRWRSPTRRDLQPERRYPEGARAGVTSSL